MDVRRMWAMPNKHTFAASSYLKCKRTRKAGEESKDED